MMYLKKSELINIIQSLETFESPKLQYEQYFTDAVATADIFFHIAFEQNDLQDKIVLDLGCGGGNLTIAAALLGARKVIGIDIDPEALEICRRNIYSLQLEQKITLIQGDIKTMDLQSVIFNHLKQPIEQLRPIIVVSNPPFGVKKRGSDLAFIKKSITVADIIYSLHLSHPKNQEFLSKKILQLGGTVDRIFPLKLVLKRSYSFHKKKRKFIQADLYRILCPTYKKRFYSH
ncbi:METTL5 family protein [Candidatus Harpocratesius sp.]